MIQALRNDWSSAGQEGERAAMWGTLARGCSQTTVRSVPSAALQPKPLLRSLYPHSTGRVQRTWQMRECACESKLTEISRSWCCYLNQGRRKKE